MTAMRPLALALAALCLAPTLSGCALHPLYADGGSGSVATSLRAIEVGPIGGQSGWLVRNALNDRFHRQGETAPRYRLEVELDDDITGFGVRQDNAISRERRTLRARYRLLDSATGAVLLDQAGGLDHAHDLRIDLGTVEPVPGDIVERPARHGVP